MHRHLLALTAALVASAAAAQEGDPLKSAECQHALEALQAQEAAAAREMGQRGDAARQAAAQGRLETLRLRAAHVCLKGRADPPPAPQRFAQPPIGVPPVATPPAVQPARPVAPMPPSPRMEPPLTVMGCDVTGCWAQGGSRLQRVGPNLLMGPHGVCSLQGTLLHCP